jgi:hypothetical protein
MTNPAIRRSLARLSLICAVLTVIQSFAQQEKASAPKQSLPIDALDSLTAPIALYPDALVAQKGHHPCDGRRPQTRMTQP